MEEKCLQRNIVHGLKQDVTDLWNRFQRRRPDRSLADRTHQSTLTAWAGQVGCASHTAEACFVINYVCEYTGKGAKERRDETPEEREKRQEKIADAVRTILACIGEDPDREGLLKTPERYAKALMFFTKGYEQNIRGIKGDDFGRHNKANERDWLLKMWLTMQSLKKVRDKRANGHYCYYSSALDIDHDEMVIVKDVDVFSLCEHHMVPFTGKISIGYIPNRRVVGLSKLARIAEMFMRR